MRAFQEQHDCRLKDFIVTCEYIEYTDKQKIARETKKIQENAHENTITKHFQEMSATEIPTELSWNILIIVRREKMCLPTSLLRQLLIQKVKPGINSQLLAKAVLRRSCLTLPRWPN